MKSNIKLTFLLGAAVAAMNLAAYAGPGPQDFPVRVKTKKEAEACCIPGNKVALACKDCKTLDAKSGEEKKSILAWFAPDEKHDCSGCSGKITVKKAGGDKGATVGEFTHVCTKCGENSAYTCAMHSKKA